MIRTHTYYVTRKEYYKRFLHNNEKYKKEMCERFHKWQKENPERYKEVKKAAWLRRKKKLALDLNKK